MLTFLNQTTLQACREETLNGVSYLVVPGIPIKEQVLKYYFVNADEIGKFVNTWNGIPLVINHPSENHGSARVLNPDVPVVGTFYNAEMDGKKLTGEYWFDLEKLRAAPGGKKIESAVRNGRMIETSTGYFADEIPAEGEYEGVSYTAMHQNLCPDHIAILPDAIGACSVEDGCGLPRLNCAQNCATCASKKENAMPEPKEPSVLEKIKALLGGAPTATLNECACPPAAEAASETPAPSAPAETAQSEATPVAATNSGSVMLNADEYAYVRAYISLSAELGGTENIKRLLLLMQDTQTAQAAQDAQNALDRANELAAAVPSDASPDGAVQNQAANEPVNYAGAVAPETHLNAAQGLALPVAIPFK